MVSAWEAHMLEVGTPHQSFPISSGTIKLWDRRWKGWDQEEQEVNDKCSSLEFPGPPLEKLKAAILALIL